MESNKVPTARRLPPAQARTFRRAYTRYFLCLWDRISLLAWGPFLESPGNFSGPKSNIQIEIKRIRARVLASKLLHFVSLTDSFIMLDAKLLKPRSLMETETAYRAR